MKLKLYCLLVPAMLSLAGTACAQGYINGSVGIQEDSSQTGSYSASSLALDAANFTAPGSATLTFSSTVPDGTEVTANSATINGISSSSPETVSISDFLQIGSAGHFGSVGTTPTNRFDFDLQTIEEPASGTFVGFGTLSDTAGIYSDTPFQMTLNFSGANNYSFILEAVPEPATITLALAGLGGLLVLRRKS